MWTEFGISDRQGQVYETLACYRQVEATALAAELGMTPVQVNQALGRLVARGMVSRLPGRPARFTAMPPDQVVAHHIAEHEQQIAQLRGFGRQLTDVYRRASVSWRQPSELVEVVEGADNVANTFSLLQRQAEKQVRGFDCPPYLVDPGAGNPEEARHHADRSITYRVVYDHSALEVPGRMSDIWNGIHAGELARVGDVPMKMVLCDDQAALIPYSAWGGLDTGCLIRPSSLLDAMISLFESIWDHSVALNHGAEAKPTTRSRTDDDAELLGLMAGGSTDESIARALGWNVRTVRRHVQRLMVEVGADTRFQLGMEAVRLGWL